MTLRMAGGDRKDICVGDWMGKTAVIRKNEEFAYDKVLQQGTGFG